MNDTQRDEIFKAQTKNVRELERSWKQLNSQINALILAKKDVAVAINTKLLALIYCALAEAVFSKLIHTPGGLDLGYVDQIKNAPNVKTAWLRCAELAMQRVEGAKSSHGPNVKKRLLDLIDNYIFDPSLLRNKLAHGQWSVALNRENTAVNQEITDEIEKYDVVELYRRKASLSSLSTILEDIIESPNKAHHRDYWSHLVKFEEQQRMMADWNYGRKVAQLFEKKSHAPKGSAGAA